MPARPTPVRSAHPLLGAFPLAVMTLSTFLVVFTLLMARLTALPSTSPPAGGAGASALVAASGGGAIRTRASGGAAAGATTTVASAGAPAVSAPAVITRSSGSGRGFDD